MSYNNYFNGPNKIILRTVSSKIFRYFNKIVLSARQPNQKYRDEIVGMKTSLVCTVFTLSTFDFLNN